MCLTQTADISLAISPKGKNGFQQTFLANDLPTVKVIGLVIGHRQGGCNQHQLIFAPAASNEL